MGIKNSQIYYSSYEETGAKYLEDCFSRIEEEFNENELLELSYSRTYTKTEKMYINSMDFALGKISYDEFMAQVMKINND